MSVSSNRYFPIQAFKPNLYIGYYQDGKRKWKSTGATVKIEALKALTHVKELIGGVNKL